MLNGLNPINSLFQPSDFWAGTGPMDLSADFNTIYNNLLTQKNTAPSAKTAVLQAQFSKTMILADMFADSKTSFLGFGISNLFGVGGPFGLPAWTYDAARVLGDANSKNLINMSQQAALLAQSRFDALGFSNGGDIFSSLI